MSRRLLALLLVGLIAFLLMPSVRALGYDQDTHYYFTFYLALQTACLDWWEAWIIASADWSQDLNHTTVSEKSIVEVVKGLFGGTPSVPNQRNWHAFSEKGNEEARLKRQGELWFRVEQQEDSTMQLVYLGQLLHFAQDFFAHRGYDPGLGHGLATIIGNDPDALQDKQRERSMVRSSSEFLTRECDKLARDHAKVESVEGQVGPLIEKLIRPATLGWRFSSRQADLAAVMENIRLLGQAVEEHEESAIPRCWATLVGDGGRKSTRWQRLIPSAIKIEYDQAREPTNLEEVEKYINDLKSSMENCDEGRVERLYGKVARPAEPIVLSDITHRNMPFPKLISLGFVALLAALVVF